jgi:predicted acylesterase/phospholipase RssA/catechol 2,3-dioxygenase-like lactoylglutathione lyase family enzyme
MRKATHINKQVPYLVIYVENLERSRDFYSGQLGLRVRDFPVSSTMGEHALALSVQGTTIILMSKKAGELYFGSTPGAVMPDPGHCFPAWQVPDLHAFHQHAVAGGVECLQQPKEDVFGRVAYYRDPDGLLFSVVQPKATEDTHGYVLSGGGALGAFELGILQALVKNETPAPAVITGTSVGGFNAAVLVCEMGGGKSFEDAVDGLSGIWIKDIAGGYHDNGVFRFRGDMARLAAPAVSTRQALEEMAQDAGFFTRDAFRKMMHVALTRGSLGKRLAEIVDVSTLLSTEPLRDLVKKRIDFSRLEKSPTALNLATTEWTTGKLRLFTHTPHHGRRRPTVRADEELITEANFRDAVLASTAIPGVFPTVAIQCQTAHGSLEKRQFADGGLVMNSPLNPAIESGAKTLHLLCVNPEVDELPMGEIDNTLETMTRALVAAVAGFTNNDLDQVRLVNRIAGIVRRKHSDEFYRAVTVHRYHPKIGNLGGLTGLLDFSPRHVEALMEDGIMIATHHDCEESRCILAS